jgi:hypothetical protein
MIPGQDAGPQLRDIHLPPAPGWWPPAPGWWLLALIAIAIVVVLVLLLRRVQRRRRWRRSVLRELDAAAGAAANDAAALAAALSAFLRRLLRRADPVAPTLAGERWLQRLDACAGSDEFTRGIGRVLAEAPYRPAPNYDKAALIALVRRCTRRVLAGEAGRA